MVAATLTLLLACASPAPSQGEPFSFVGPMSKLMADGGVASPVSGGLPYSIPIGRDGSLQQTQSFEVSRPSWNGKAAIQFDGLAYSGGILKGRVKVVNSSSQVLQGLRLDVAGATEQYLAKDAEGKDVTKVRTQSAKIASPLLFGDLQPKESSPEVSFEVSGIEIKPETQGIAVGGGLTGLALVAHLNPVTDLTPVSIDFDAAGKMYLVGANKEALYRCDTTGKNASAVASLPAAGIAVAVDGKSGSIYASVSNGTEFLKFAAGGQDAGKVSGIEETVGFSGWTGKTRFGQDGRMYVNFGEGVARLAGVKPEVLVIKVGSYLFESYLSFDVSKDGAMWVGTRSTIFRVDQDGKNGKRIVNGPSTQPGKVNQILALRLDGAGNLYVAEDMGAECWPRVSVFDPQGRLVRMFGRSTQKKRNEDEEPRLGEVMPGPVDFAFGSDGRLYMVHSHLDQPILVFEPF